jgi:hypothetical protein
MRVVAGNLEAWTGMWEAARRDGMAATGATTGYRLANVPQAE